MAVLTTGTITVPNSLFDPWVSKIGKGSAVAELSDSIPMKFGPGQAFTYNIGEAEYVAESGAKGASTITRAQQTYGTFKFHKTLRYTEEVLWADEDHQLEVLENTLNQIQPALSRALDFGVIHGVNPATGSDVGAMSTHLESTTNSVSYDGTDPVYDYLDEAFALVLEDDGLVNGIALSPVFAGEFARARTTDGVKLYPGLSFGTAASSLEGYRASVSNTVSAAGVITPATNLLGIVGDFTSVRWGIQKAIGLEIIRYGDPDGGGDLKRENEVAFRAEVVYGWGIASVNHFAKILDVRDESSSS